MMLHATRYFNCEVETAFLLPIPMTVHGYLWKEQLDSHSRTEIQLQMVVNGWIDCLFVINAISDRVVERQME